METYIVAGTYSAGSNMANFDFDNPNAAIEKADKALEAVGGKVLHGWTTLGRFDFIVVVEVPSAEAVRAWVACLGVATETMQAFSDTDDNSGLFENVKKVLAVMSQ
jgi:uncharacterized protein with GYD domain